MEIYKFDDFINEALITFGGKAYPKYDNVVILAGGAGSGKGFQLSNLLGIEGKILNVDDLKTRAVDIANRAENLQKDSVLVNRIKTETGIDLTQLDFKNPSDVNNLHIAIKKIDLDNNLKNTLINSIRDYQYKPNLIFDVTLSDMEDLEKITKQCREMGYAPENIHIVWVINSIEVAIDQNNKRSRVVPAHILLNTHQGAATTMRRILELGDIAKSSFDGDIWFTFNKFVKNAEDNDVESRIGNTTKYTKSAAIYIEKANYIKVKNKGQKAKKYDEIGLDIVNKINQYSKDNFK